MARELKVYGWTGFVHRQGHGQFRIIVAATSFAAAQRAAEEVGIFKPGRDWYSTSGNPHDLQTALPQPGVVFARPLDDWDGAYLPIPPAS